MKILYFFDGKDFEKEAVQGHFKEKVAFFEGSLQDNPGVTDGEVDVLAVFVDSHVDGDVMDRFPNLKFIAARSTGYDNIDLEEAEKRGIVVSNVPAYGRNTVSEHAFGLLLMLSRALCEGFNRVRKGNFSKEGLLGFDLEGRTIGVIGAGNIGRHSIQVAKGFGMNVLAFDVNKDEEFAKKMDFKYVELDELYKQSDIITLHVPLIPPTEHMINKDSIAKMKEGVYIVNTSRGAVVYSPDLADALESGHVGGVALDVLEYENDMPNAEIIIKEKGGTEEAKIVEANRRIINHENAIVVPHIGAQTREAILRIVDISIENIESYRKDSPQNIVSI